MTCRGNFGPCLTTWSIGPIVLKLQFQSSFEQWSTKYDVFFRNPGLHRGKETD